ncbi:MAG: hypothetical protein GX550_00860, partial [Syntrophomonadaceae bacterium]|nr:hypothetical protein [Syntrophomonadaceae bacterium]
MAQLIIEVLKQEARVNSAVFPMFAGFASAQEIKTIASVPGFSHNKEHQQIATDLLHPPIDEWQRPLDQSRVRKIKAVYNSTIKNNLMPNPVLLGATSANLDPQNDISLLVRSKTMPVPNGSIIVPNLYEIIIDYDPNNPKKPIWILDGQHRIEGMFSSSQRTQPIPFILLYDTTGNSYTPSFLAEIFTHVTTGAKPMDNIHQEWMKYSFDLPSYDEIATKNALTTVIHLCSTQTFGTINNPFINQIQFNPRKRKPGYYGFKFDMIEWSNIMRENYFGLGGSLPPIELAEEIVKAIKALEGLDSYY